MTRTARFGFLLLALAPLAYLPGAFTHDDVPKQLCVSLAVFLLAAAWLNAALRRGALEWRHDRLALPVALVWAASLASFVACVLRGGNPYEAFWPLFLQAGGILVYLAASNIPGDERFVRETLPRWMVGAACVVAAYGLLQRAGIDPLNPALANPDREPGSTLGGKTFAGEYLALVFPLALALIFMAVSRAGRAAAAGASLLIGAHLLVTGARGAWLGAGAGTGLFMLLGLVKRVGPERRRAVTPRTAAVAAGAVLSVAVVAQLAGAVDWVGRLRGAVAPAPGCDTALVRRELWKSTARMAADHPVLGVGPGQYVLNIQPYRSLVEMRESDPQRLGRSAGMAHNDFLQHVAEAGAIGGAVLMLVLVALVRKSAAHLKGQEDRGAFLLTAGLLGGVLGAAGAGLVGNALHQPAVGMLAMLFLGVAGRVGTPPSQMRADPVLNVTRAGMLLVAVCGVLGFLIGLRWILDDYRFAHFLAVERNLETDGRGPWRGRYSARLHDAMTSSLGVERWDIHRSLALVYMRTSHPDDRQRARVHLERAKVLNPNDAELWNAGGLLSLMQGTSEKARGDFERAVRLDPIVRQPRLNLALAYEQDDLPDKALTQYEALVQLDPRDAEAHLWRGMALVTMGRHAEAAAAFAAAERAGHYAEPVRRFDLRGTLKRDGKWKAFRESEAGRTWLDGKRD